MLPQAEAAVGFSLPPSSLPEQVCMIRFYDAHGDLAEICSATLMAPKFLHSAGHCFHGNGFDKSGKSSLRNEVSCPNGEKRSVARVKRAAAYSEEEARKDDEMRRFDSAIVELTSEIHLPTMPYISERKAVERLLASSPGCALLGYGGVEHTSREFGKLKGTLVDPKTLSIRESGLVYLMGIGGWNSGSVEGGDSGGSLACLAPGSFRWIHIANISAKDYNYGSLLAPLFLSPELLSGMDQTPALGAEAGLSKARLGFLHRESQAELMAIERLLERTAPERLRELRRSLDGLASERDGESLLSLLQSEKMRAINGAVGKTLRVLPFTRVELDHSSIALDEASQIRNFMPEKNPYSLADQSVNHFTMERIEGRFAVGKLRLFGSSDYFSYLGCKHNVICVPGIFDNVKVPLERLDPSLLR
jgi:hypothetical protein